MATQAQWWDGTINNYNNPQDIQTFINVCESNDWKYHFQQETGKTTGTPHLQICLGLGKRVRRTQITKILAEAEPPMANTGNWRPARCTRALYKYCSRDDKRDAGTEVYSNMEGPPRGRGERGKGKHERRDSKPELPKFTAEQLGLPHQDKLWVWQRQLVDIVSQEPEPTGRTIHFWIDPIGHTGKSLLCKYLAYHHDAVQVGGKASDTASAIRTYMEKKQEAPKIVIVDVPRAYQNYVSYVALETAKNGNMWAPKYDSTSVIWPNPHVHVFLNNEPNLEELSDDRPVIHRIRDIPHWNEIYLGG